MCASSAYNILPLIKSLCVGQGLQESENTGNPLVINKELSNNSAGLISNLKQKAYSKVKICHIKGTQRQRQVKQDVLSTTRAQAEWVQSRGCAQFWPLPDYYPP